MTNLRGLGAALGIYASQSGGLLPPSPSWQNASMMVEVYRENDGHPEFSRPDGMRGYQNGYFGHGLLYEMKLVEDPLIYYCPDLKESKWLSYPGGWDPAERNNIYPNWKFCSYYYRLFGQTQNGVGLTSKDIRDLMELTESADEAITADVFLDVLTRGQPAHLSLSSLVVGYADGHVAVTEMDEKEYSRCARAKHQSGSRTDLFVHLYWRALGSGDYTELDERGFRSQ